MADVYSCASARAVFGTSVWLAAVPTPAKLGSFGPASHGGSVRILCVVFCRTAEGLGMLEILKTAGSALTAQRLRMDVVASNLANAEATSTPEGGPYKRERVV